jgi:hypothetical protein
LTIDNSATLAGLHSGSEANFTELFNAAEFVRIMHVGSFK